MSYDTFSYFSKNTQVSENTNWISFSELFPTRVLSSEYRCIFYLETPHMLTLTLSTCFISFRNCPILRRCDHFLCPLGRRCQQLSLSGSGYLHFPWATGRCRLWCLCHWQDSEVPEGWTRVCWYAMWNYGPVHLYDRSWGPCSVAWLQVCWVSSES